MPLFGHDLLRNYSYNKYVGFKATPHKDRLTALRGIALKLVLTKYVTIFCAFSTKHKKY